MSTIRDMPAGWELLTLGELVEVLDHRRVPVNRTERERRRGDVPYYGATGQVGWIDDALFDEPLVLLGEDGVQFFDPFAQKAYVISGRSWVNNHAHVLRPLFERVSLDYLCHALNTADYRGAANGTTRLKLTKSAMLRLTLPVPPRDEQDDIVGALDDLNLQLSAGTASMERALDGLRHYRAAVLACAFGPPTVALREAAHIQSGIAKGRPQGGETIEMPYIRTANVQALRLELDEVKTILVTPEQRERHLLQAGDVLVLEGGDADKVGRGWIWRGEIPDCLHQNHVFAVRPDEQLLLPEYLAYYINAPQGRSYFLSVAKQTTNLASINKTNLNALPVSLPPVAEQARVVKMLDEQLAATSAAEANFEFRLQDAAHLRRAILQSALEGRLTPGSISAVPLVGSAAA